MNSTTAPQPAGFSLPRNAPAAARSTLQLLQRLRHGSLTLQLPDGTVQRFGGGAGPLASMRLNNWNVFSAAIKSGDIGFAETYIAGDWSTPQLTDLLRLLIANRSALEDVVYGSWLGRLAYRLNHLLHRNSKANSRKNIHAHYDLGNPFYRTLARRDHELLVGAVRTAGAGHGVGAARQGAPRAAHGRRASRATGCWRSAAAGVRWPRRPPPSSAPR